MAPSDQTYRPFVPLRRGNQPAWLTAATVVAGALALAIGSWIRVPMTPVPMTLQTYVVLLIGALFGWRLGLTVIAVYLAAAAVGLPVLAGGTSGVSRFTGPTGGYLAGFAVTTIVVGLLAERGWTSSLRRSLTTMFVGHVVTLAIGAAWLGTRSGWDTAWESGLRPFLAGAAVKAALAATTVDAVRLVQGSGTDGDRSGGSSTPR